MKRLIAVFITVVLLLTVIFLLTSCSSPKIEGKYYLQSLMYDKLDDGWPMITAVINVEQEYECVVGGQMDFSKFYLEFTKEKLIVHGGWALTGGPNVQFVIYPDNVAEYSYELKESTQKGWYDVYLKDIGRTEPYCSFLPRAKYNSAIIHRQYMYGLAADREQITCNYYLEGSSELNR